jgi:hypothetical protein
MASGFGDARVAGACLRQRRAQRRRIDRARRRDQQRQTNPVRRIAEDFSAKRAERRRQTARPTLKRQGPDRQITRRRLGQRLRDEKHRQTGGMIRPLDERQRAR